MIRCPACGSSTSAAERHCRRCGNDLTSPGALAVLTAAPDDSGERTEVIDPFERVDLVTPGPGSRRTHPPGSRRGGQPPGSQAARGGGPRLAGMVIAVLGVLLLAAGGYGGYRALVDGRTDPLGATVAPSGTAGPSPGRTAPTTSVAPTPPPLVEAAPGIAADPATAGVVRLLTAYFGAINARDFNTARGTLVDRPALPQTAAEFRRQYRSTRDSDVHLLGLEPDGTGGYLASVTFTSRQDPADAPDGVSPCLNWSMSYPLVRVDGTLRIDVVRRSNVNRRPC
jgi:hypothetical protein